MKKTVVYWMLLVFSLVMVLAPAVYADEASLNDAKDRAVKALLKRMDEPYPGLYGCLSCRLLSVRFHSGILHT